MIPTLHLSHPTPLTCQLYSNQNDLTHDHIHSPPYTILPPDTPSSHLSPLTSEVVRAPQMTLQQYLSTIPCLPLPSGNLQPPFPFIPWCYLPINSFVFLSLLLSLSPAELSLPCLRILRCGHTIWVSISLPWLGDHHALIRHTLPPPNQTHSHTST